MILLSLCLTCSFADSLYSQGDYARAVIEYKRLLFAGAVESSYTSYRIGMSYKSSGRHGESIHHFRKALSAPVPSPSEESISLQLADVYLRTRQYSLARLELEGIRSSQARTLHAASHLLEWGFEDAGRILDETSDPTGELRTVVQEGERLRLLDERMMAICSAILPGSGQILSGHVVDGILSFLLVSSSGFLAYDAVRDKRYVDASLIFGQLFWRFYGGNIQSTYRLAAEENLRRRMTLLRSSELLNQYLD